MRHKYTKNQIIESIKHWKNVLDTMNLVDDQYMKFYNKKPSAVPVKAMNLNVTKMLEEAVLKSCIQSKDICAYNPNSYMNLKRIYESNAQYLDEKKRETKNTSQLIEMLRSYCKRNTIPDFDDKQFDEVFSVECYDPDSSGKIYGNIVLDDFPFDVSKHIIEYHVNLISRRAILLGYNYVDHRIASVFNEDGIRCCIASIQFEATYFSSNVKHGDILYHVTAKSLVHKILKNGLMPSNKNTHGFNYESRIFCFIDKYDQIMKEYAAVSGKRSKKFILNDKLKDDVLDFYEELQKKSGGVLFDTHEFSVLAIDTAKLEDVKFFRNNTFDIDGDFIAVYTDQAIPPNAIRYVNDIITY